MSPPLRIAPSILACDFSRLGEELARAEEAGADWHHVDVMDGHFVPNLSIGLPVVAAARQASRIPLDVHLMIEEPGEWAERYAEAGADLLSFHYEAAAERFPATLERFRATGRRVGVALNPPAPVEPLREHLDDIDLVLVMSVHAGFGGQAFMPEVLEKVERLRSWGYAGDVQMDGGVDADTAMACRAAGANVLVAGTYLYRAADMPSALAAMRRPLDADEAAAGSS
jgi:ribulose-phosphate 3-epimerase